MVRATLARSPRPARAPRRATGRRQPAGPHGSNVVALVRPTKFRASVRRWHPRHMSTALTKVPSMEGYQALVLVSFGPRSDAKT